VSPTQALEREISEHVCQYYRSKQYSVFRELSIGTGKEPDNRIDVAGVKWADHAKLDSLAVECKRGGSWREVGSALNQALAYKKVFPRVYIAAEASENELDHMKAVLVALGLGYLQVDLDGNVPVREIMQPEESQLPLTKENRFMSVVMRRLGRYAAYQSVWNTERMRWGHGESRRRFYISGYEENHLNFLWHYIESLDPTTGRPPHDPTFGNRGEFMERGINFESTLHLKRLFESTRPQDLLDVLKKLPDDAVLKLYDFELVGGRKTQFSRTEFCAELGAVALRDLTEHHIKRLYEYCALRRYIVWLLVVKRSLIDESEDSCRSYAEEAGTLQKEFGPLYDFILDKIGSKRPALGHGNDPVPDPAF